MFDEVGFGGPPKAASLIARTAAGRHSSTGSSGLSSFHRRSRSETHAAQKFIRRHGPLAGALDLQQAQGPFAAGDEAAVVEDVPGAPDPSASAPRSTLTRSGPLPKSAAKKAPGKGDRPRI